MESNDLQQLKLLIEEQISTLNSEIENLQDLSKPVKPDRALGRLSRMDAIQNKNMNEATLHLTEKKIKKLEQALEKIDEPDFGLCEVCDKKIPFARLQLMPESTLCVSCAEKKS